MENTFSEHNIRLEKSKELTEEVLENVKEVNLLSSEGKELSTNIQNLCKSIKSDVDETNSQVLLVWKEMNLITNKLFDVENNANVNIDCWAKNMKDLRSITYKIEELQGFIQGHEIVTKKELDKAEKMIYIEKLDRE
jgi:hypothetical protein